jgi:hypothetical protein
MKPRGNGLTTERGSGPNADVARAWRAARPHDLGSLRRLADTLRRVGQVDGRLVQTWIGLMSGVPHHGVSLRAGEGARPLEPERLPEASVCEPVRQIVAVGLAAVPALVDALRMAERAPRRKAALRTIVHSVDALARIRPVPTCAIPAVLNSIGGASSKVRAHILFELAGPLRPRATPFVIRTLQDCLDATQEDRVRITAAQALSRLEGDLPRQARDAALAGLTDSHRWVRHFCLVTLARVHDPDEVVRTALCEQFHSHEDHRPEIIRALLCFDEGQALAHLAGELRRQAPGEAGLERYRRCLRLLEELGSRAVPVLWAVRRCGPVESACVAAVLRGELKDSAPPPRPPAGERAARLLAPLDRPGLAAGSRAALLAWVDSLSQEDHELGARVALAAVRRVAYLYDMDEHVRDKAEEVEQWILARGRRELGAPAQLGPVMGLLAEGAGASQTHPDINPHVSAERDHTLWAARSMARVIESAVAPWKHVNSAVGYACQALAESTGPVFSTITVEAPWYESDAVTQVRQAIIDEILPWIMGTWDPVADVRSQLRD